MKKLVFFPWDSILASEAQKMLSWTNTGDFKTDHYTGAVVNSMKSRVAGQIYIFGHCSPGSLTLSNDNNDHLQYDEVADRIETSGLPKVFSGAIKIFACESGSPGTTMSFAKRFAKYLYFDKKYLLARVYGYKRPLNSDMSTEQQTKLGRAGNWVENDTYFSETHTKAHKWATSDYWVNPGDVSAVKAKDARSYFSPFGS